MEAGQPMQHKPPGARGPAVETPGAGDPRHAQMAEQCTEWFERHADALQRYARHLTDDDAAAEDVVQETFVRLYLHLACGRPEPTVGWLYTVARRLVVDWHRRGRWVLAGDLATTPSASDPGEALSRRDYGAWLLDQLPAHERVVVQLFYYEGLSAEAIAKGLGTTANAVRVRLTRARHRLEARLQDETGVAQKGGNPHAHG